MIHTPRWGEVFRVSLWDCAAKDDTRLRGICCEARYYPVTVLGASPLLYAGTVNPTIPSVCNAELPGAVVTGLARHRPHKTVMQASAPVPFRDLTHPYDIRLLHLDARARSSPLTGSLEHTNLGSQPPYEALSYEWGGQEKTGTITLQDGFTLPITESLHGALEDLREDAGPGMTRVLWIDAICINQQDIRELESQVSIMTHIYRYATRVVTYIGPERDNSTAAISFARTLCRHAENRYTGDDRPRSPETRLTRSSLPPESDPRWEAVKALTLRTWVRCPQHAALTAPTNLSYLG